MHSTPSNNFARRLSTRTARIGLALSLVAMLPVSVLVAAFAKADQTPKVGDTAPDYTWEAVTGGKMTLSKMTAKGPVVLIMLRGFPGYQCPICTAQVGELRSKADKFSAAKAQVILVYPGPSAELKKRAEEFVTGKDLPANFTLVLDPNYGFTNKYGLRWNAPNETSYPSTFVIDGKGKIVFAKTSRSHGGRAKSDEILAALAPAMAK